MKKVIILDFDGTLYSGKHIFDKVAGKVIANRRKFLPSFSDSEYEEMIKKYPHWNEVITGRDIVDAIYTVKNMYPNKEVSTKAFFNWQNDDIYELVLDEKQFADVSFIKQLCQKYPVYIVSNSSINHLKHYMGVLDIDPSWFKEIISNHFEEFDRTKKHYYQDICDKENAKPENVFVFGDSIASDLEPGKQLNMKTYFINDATTVKTIVNQVLGEEMSTQKIEMIDKYLLKQDLVNGYMNMANPHFDMNVYRQMSEELEKMKKELEKYEITDKDILDRMQELESQGEIFER